MSTTKKTIFSKFFSVFKEFIVGPDPDFIDKPEWECWVCKDVVRGWYAERPICRRCLHDGWEWAAREARVRKNEIS